MKTLKYIFVAAALGLTATSCYDLDLEPKGLVYENVLFQSDNGIKKYLASAYHDLPIEDFNYGQNGDQKGYATSSKGGNQWQAQKSSAASCAAEAAGRATSYGCLLYTSDAIGLMIVSVNLTICWKNCLSIKAILRKMFIILI